MEKKISIIVPVYNTKEEYTIRMINSINGQNYDNYEIIIVDDGSNEKTRAYLDEIATTNKRIKLFHTDNGGVSSARNYGIKQATGEYISFLDSDDCLDESFFCESVELAEKYTADIGYGTIKNIPEQHEWLQKKDGNIDICIDNKDAIIASLLCYTNGEYPYVIIGHPGSKLIRKSLLEKISFNTNVAFSEDQLFNRKLLKSAKTVVSVSNTWYYYMQNQESTVHKAQGDVEYYNRIRPYWDELVKINEQESEYIKKICKYHALNEYVLLVYNAYLSSVEPLVRIRKAMNEAANHPLIKDAIRFGLDKEINYRLRDRVVYFMLKRKMYLFVLLCFRLYFKRG